MLNIENENDLLFFDIEVFKHNAFIVFKNINRETVAIYHNDFDGIDNTIEDKVLVGYNNHFYDNHILDKMIKQWSPEQIKRINDEIIGGTRFKNNYSFKTIDCFQQIDVAMPSLKKIEGNMGSMILESSVDFTIDRVLSPKELEEAIEYCKYDVDKTIDVYKMRVNSYFKPKLSLVERLGMPNALNWNTTTISANVLLKRPLPKWSSLRLHKDAKADKDPLNMEMFDLVPADVVDHWLNNDKGSVTVDKFGCSIEFGFGGLHGVHKTISDTKDVKLLDVASMYPHIILNIEALGTASKVYRDILEERIEVKHKDKVQSDALKLVLNSVYGNLKNQYSLLYDPRKAVSVCLYGQIALYELCKRLAPTCTLININTDGVAFTTESEDYKQVWEEWQEDFNLTLEEDMYDRFIQRDVNNYIATNGDEITVKGGDVARYHKDSLFRNNNARIIDIAIVRHILYSEDILDIITNNLDKPHLFQYILQAGRTYKGTVDQDDRMYQKINRVFASKEEGLCLFKKRQDGGIVRFPDTPENMYLWNDETDKLENFEQIVDITHYYQIITKKLERWQTEHSAVL